MKNTTKTQPATPFDRFKELAQRLMAVPKKEMDKKISEYDKKKTGRRKKLK
jgi:hypothetical protein